MADCVRLRVDVSTSRDRRGSKGHSQEQGGGPIARRAPREALPGRNAEYDAGSLFRLFLVNRSNERNEAQRHRGFDDASPVGVWIVVKLTIAVKHAVKESAM